MPLSLWNLRSKWPTPFEKRRLRPISAHNVSAIGDSEKSSITTNIKSTTGFPTSYIDGVHMLPLSPERVAQRAIFSFLWVKVNGWSSQVLSTPFAGECHRNLMVGGSVDHIHRQGLYSAARPSRRNCSITIWCGSVSSSGDLWKTLRES